MSVELVFERFANRYPNLHILLASGYPSDVGKVSDVDIGYFTPDHAKLDHLFPNATKKSKETVTIYSIQYLGREVNVYATSDIKLANRAVIHRRNEIELSKLRPELLPKVIELKLKGVKTEPAWVQALGITTDDPYETMLNNNRELF